MNLKFCSEQKEPYQMLLKRLRINRRIIFENLEIVNVTPIVMVTSYPPKPERVAKIILKVAKENFDNTCEDVLLE